MNLKPYPEYRDSGIKWIGEIPEGWEVRKLKRFFNFEKGRNAQIYTQEYVSGNKGDFPVYSGQTGNGGFLGNIKQ